MAHRPTRKHRHLMQKIEAKKAHSRAKGKKLKRLEKWAKAYEALVKDDAAA